MGLLAPLMLIGTIAAGIPIALHFFYRARYKPVPWGAMKFLKLAIEQTSRRLKFQELILLLIRVLVMLLLALALSRPISCSSSTIGKRGEAVDAIFIIDVSYSMNVREGAKTRLDIAKDTALKVIDDLPPNSTVQVITSADKAIAAGPRSPRNLDQARLLIQNLQATQQATDFLAGFSEAFLALSRTEGASKEVYLFSDMQRGGWERQSSSIRTKCEELKGQAALYLVRCGSPTVRNVSLIDIRAQSDIPHTGSRMPFTVIVKNTGTETLSGLTVTLKIDGQPLDKDAQPIEKISPGETKPITLTGKIESAGWRVLTAEVKSDQLEDDNKLDRLILIREKIRVLIVDGTFNEREPEKSGSYYLAHALMPVPEEYRSNYHVQPSVVSAVNASAGQLTDRDVCILVNVPLKGPDSLSPEFVSRLQEFVKEGHGIFIASGSNVDKDAYNQILGDGGAGLLPMPLAKAYQTPSDQPIFPDPNSIESQSFLGRFKLSSNDPFLQLRESYVLSAVGITEPTEADSSKNFSRVLLRYNNNQPTLLSKAVGDGEVLFLTTSVDKNWGFFATNLTFQPFIHGALTHLVERTSGGLNKIAGEVIHFKPKNANVNYQLIKPDGTHTNLGKPQGGTKENLSLNITETSRAGVYTISEQGAETGTKFTIIPDLRESDTLDPLPDDQIDALLSFQPEHLNSGDEATKKTGSLRNRNEWTVYVLVLLLIFAIGETAWAWYCGKAW